MTLREVLLSVALGVAGNVATLGLGSLVARIPPIRRWLEERPWAVAGLIGAAVAFVTSSGMMFALIRTAGLPDSAVVAFDNPHGCPDGWVAENSLMGSTVVGAVPSLNFSPDVNQGSLPIGKSKHKGDKSDFIPGTPAINSYATDLGTKSGTITDLVPLAFWYCKRAPE